MGDRLAARHGPKRGGLLCPFWVPIKYNVACTEVYLSSKWHLDPFSWYNRHGWVMGQWVEWVSFWMGHMGHRSVDT